jgi:hypothetical protein
MPIHVDKEGDVDVWPRGIIAELGLEPAARERGESSLDAENYE